MNDLLILLLMIFALGGLGTVAGNYFKKRGSKLGQQNPIYGWISFVIILISFFILLIFAQRILGH